MGALLDSKYSIYLYIKYVIAEFHNLKSCKWKPLLSNLVKSWLGCVSSRGLLGDTDKLIIWTNVQENELRHLISGSSFWGFVLKNSSKWTCDEIPGFWIVLVTWNRIQYLVHAEFIMTLLQYHPCVFVTYVTEFRMI